MALMVEAELRRERDDSAGTYFILESKHDQIDSPCLSIGNFQIRSSNGESLLINEFIKSCGDKLVSPLERALAGERTISALSLQINGRPRHYELHCFPRPETLPHNVGCFLIDRTDQVEHVRQLDFKVQELAMMSQAVRAFGETRNLSEILRIILLAVTAGKGMGFNRGFILLSDDSRESLWGCLATGPSSAEEAGRIWNDLSKDPLTFDEILRLYKAGERLDVHVNRLVSSINIRLAEDGDFIARAALERRTIVAGPEKTDNSRDREIHDKFGVDYMAVVPLVSGESLQGVLLADNVITRRPILPSDLNILEIFARYASDAIENSRLYGKLEHQIALLKEANEKIISSRENLVRAEKMSGIGRMSLEVAHEVRNPLTIIGGYANLRLRQMPGDDGSRKVLQLISDQVRRIEKTLDRFSSVVKMNEKKEDVYGLVDLLEDTLNMLSADPALEVPDYKFENEILKAMVFVDKILFHQALMAVIREAARLVRGAGKVRLEVILHEKTAMIFVDGGENNLKFAEDFYSGLRKRKNEQYQDMAVALEILRHYGGDIGLGTLQGMHGRLYIAVPLREE